MADNLVGIDDLMTYFKFVSMISSVSNQYNDNGLYTDVTTPEYYLSKGLQHLGMDVALEYMQDIINKNPAYIASIGSGCGAFEKILCEKLLTEIICVDPDSNKFIKAPPQFKMEPSYANVDELINAIPAIVENCAIILNWSSPNGSTFDYDAVQDLKPTHILWIGDPSGVAGGTTFLEFYNECENEETDYRIVKNTVKNGKDSWGWSIYYTIAILERI
jgi:hypothetical protein